MPFLIGFTKVNHFFDIRKKSKEIFVCNIWVHNSITEIVNSKIQYLRFRFTKVYI